MKKITIAFCVLSFLIIIIGLRVAGQTDIEASLFNSIDTTIVFAHLSKTEIADFRDKALRKTKALSKYISTIADKSKSNIEQSRAIDLSVELFMSEANVVEVSSLYRNTPIRYPIRSYLNKLKLLPYTKTTIVWFDIYFASDFKRRPDGRYEAVATIYQRFTGTRGEVGKYMDITKKNILIIIQQVEIKTGDIVEEAWEVLLGDIKVEETKQAK